MKLGDKIFCIDTKDSKKLIDGQVYTIEHISTDFVYLVEVSGGWNKSRFRYVSNKKKLTEPEDPEPEAKVPQDPLKPNLSALEFDLKELNTTTLSDGDVLVVKIPKDFTAAQYEKLQWALDKTFDHHGWLLRGITWLILFEGTTFHRITKEEAKEIDSASVVGFKEGG